MKIAGEGLEVLVRQIIFAALGVSVAVPAIAGSASSTPDELSRYVEPYVAELNKILPRMQGEGLRQEKLVVRPEGVLEMSYTVLYPVSRELLAQVNSQGRSDAVRSLCGGARTRSFLEAGGTVRYRLWTSAGSQLTSIDVKREHCR